MSTIGSFYRLLPVLGKNRQIIAVEQQGHGHTADIARPFNFAQWAEDTAELLRLLGIEKADFFGYSDGGMVALEIAMRHPELVRKLALSSAVYNIGGYYPEIGEGMKHITADVLPPQMREAYEAVVPHPENWSKLVAKAAEHARQYRGSRPEEIQAIAAPALVMVADHDIVRIEHAAELARLLRTELVVLPNSDHVTYLLERPDALLAKLTAFLDASMQEAEQSANHSSREAVG
ncbi:MAG: alpha/beta hydrolase [Chloroflexota bacterium]|nr:alpha/beta hydrolase [Chloroflexota bacterium]